jgi:hypothetical protein
VLGPEGKPIPRAVVHIGGDDSSYSCGADGTFSMTVENTGSVTLRYEGEAYVGDEAEPRADDLFAEATSEAHEGEEIVLRASRPEGGRLQSVLVLDPDGQPVEGAQVSHAIGFEWEEAGTTDPLGLVTVTGLRARAYRWAAAAPVNAVPSRSEMTVTSPGPSLIVLRLERPRLLRGRVQIPEGIDAKDVRIVLQVVTATRDSKHFQRPDPDGGTFAIDVTGSERRAGELGAVCVVYAEVGPQERPTHRGPRAPVDVRNPTDVVLTLDPVR